MTLRGAAKRLEMIPFDEISFDTAPDYLIKGVAA